MNEVDSWYGFLSSCQTRLGVGKDDQYDAGKRRDDHRSLCDTKYPHPHHENSAEFKLLLICCEPEGLYYTLCTLANQYDYNWANSQQVR